MSFRTVRQQYFSTRGTLTHPAYCRSVLFVSCFMVILFFVAFVVQYAGGKILDFNNVWFNDMFTAAFFYSLPKLLIRIGLEFYSPLFFIVLLGVIYVLVVLQIKKLRASHLSLMWLVPSLSVYWWIGPLVLMYDWEAYRGRKHGKKN